jgi:hypothetical protein
MFTDADFEEKIDAAVAVSGEFLPPPGAQFEGQLVRLRFFRDEAEIGEKVNIYGPKKAGAATDRQGERELSLSGDKTRVKDDSRQTK